MLTKDVEKNVDENIRKILMKVNNVKDPLPVKNSYRITFFISFPIGKFYILGSTILVYYQNQLQIETVAKTSSVQKDGLKSFEGYKGKHLSQCLFLNNGQISTLQFYQKDTPPHVPQWVKFFGRVLYRTSVYDCFCREILSER